MPPSASSTERAEIDSPTTSTTTTLRLVPASAPDTPDPLLPIVGARMHPVVERLRIYADLPETLLLHGPTGAGKSRLARWVHARSPRHEAPMVTLDLSTVPRDMQMAELFGWRRGAFTGAVRDQDGAVRRAGRGTLFIDEIDKLSLACQAGLLRLLEERRYRVLGDDRGDHECQARIIAGTNADLHAAVGRGEFREDLYYRLNVLVTRVPALSERRDELADWASFMARRRHDEAGSRGPATITAAAGQRLVAASWPGNLRQLDNVIRRAWALALSQAVDAIDAPHVELALADETGPCVQGGSLLDLLEQAADTLLDDQLRRPAAQRLTLDDIDVFRGLVLERAADRLGDVGEAFVLFGGRATVEGRNHARAFRRARRGMQTLRGWLQRRP